MNPSEYVSIVSFPGLGIGEFPVNRLAFRLFGIDIMWPWSACSHRRSCLRAQHPHPREENCGSIGE